jgi:hypothetical protein
MDTRNSELSTLNSQLSSNPAYPVTFPFDNRFTNSYQYCAA